MSASLFRPEWNTQQIILCTRPRQESNRRRLLLTVVSLLRLWPMAVTTIHVAPSVIIQQSVSWWPPRQVLCHNTLNL